MESNAFLLPDGRKVIIDKKTGIYNISRMKGIKKEKYNAFVESYVYSDNFYTKIRSYFHKLQAGNFQKKPKLICKAISLLSTYVPSMKKNKGNFLDIGCNTGIFLSMLPDTWNKYGVEVNDTAYKEALKINNISVSHTKFEKFKPNVKFDFVRASHVIEHLQNPNVFFKKIHDITNPKARILIYTPNSFSFSLLIFKKYWACFIENTHIKIFNINNLSVIAKNNGFKVIQSGTYPMGIVAGTIRGFSKKLENSAISSMVFLLLFILFYPFSIIANILKRGSVLYLYLEKTNEL